MPAWIIALITALKEFLIALVPAVIAYLIGRRTPRPEEHRLAAKVDSLEAAARPSATPPAPMFPPSSDAGSASTEIMIMGGLILAVALSCIGACVYLQEAVQMAVRH